MGTIDVILRQQMNDDQWSTDLGTAIRKYRNRRLKMRIVPTSTLRSSILAVFPSCVKLFARIDQSEVRMHVGGKRWFVANDLNS